jgi:dihydroorotate dehydrogenase electron transfer subunit
MEDNVERTIDCKILSNKHLAHDMYEMTLSCETSWIKPGKFFNVKIPGYYLRRPMGVCDWTKNSFSFIYKVIGRGTAKLTTFVKGQSLNVLIDLGNHFSCEKTDGKPLLVSGGSGIGPIHCLAKYFKQKKIPFELVVGFQNKDMAVYVKEFKTLCNNVHICTDDGSLGEKGNVVDIINKYKLSDLYYFTCGATAMMKSIYKTCKQGQLSLDERMGCGFGACMGCSIKTKKGVRQICKDGPVFKSEDLLW